jgi:hypothetical protein
MRGLFIRRSTRWWRLGSVYYVPLVAVADVLVLNPACQLHLDRPNTGPCGQVPDDKVHRLVLTVRQDNLRCRCLYFALGERLPKMLSQRHRAKPASISKQRTGTGAHDTLLVYPYFFQPFDGGSPRRGSGTRACFAIPRASNQTMSIARSCTSVSETGKTPGRRG